MCKGESSKVSWTQVETGSSNMEVSSCILKGDNSVGEFYSVAVTKGKQQADTGTKMFLERIPKHHYIPRHKFW